MTRYTVPSGSRPGVNYEVTLTDDGGLVCECQGYSRKAAVSYVTGVRHGLSTLCRHARQVAATFGLAPRQPRFMWSSLADGKTFPVTARPRGREEHMLAYRYDGILEPLESAKDEVFPKPAARADRDRSGRVIDLLTAPPHEIVVVTTGVCPPEVATPKAVKQLIAGAGAYLKPGNVTAETTVLAVGNRPNHKKLARAAELLTPTVDFPGLIAIFTGRKRCATDHWGHPLLPQPGLSDLQNVPELYAALLRDLENDRRSNWIQTLDDRHKLHQALGSAAQSVDRVIAVLEDENPGAGSPGQARDTLNAVSAMMRKMASQTLPAPEPGLLPDTGTTIEPNRNGAASQ